MEKVVIVAAKRTPIGSFGGAFKDHGAVDLATTILKDLITDLKLDVSSIDEVIMGNVLQAGLGQNVARQISINSGIPVEVPAFTVNKVCGSGLKSVQLGVQSILLGDADVVVVGGTENMSQAPYLLKDYRWGKKMGDTFAEDMMLKDGLTDAFSQKHMGITAENIAEKYNISREEQDEFAYESQRKAIKAQGKGAFIEEIVPVTIESRRDETIVDSDEYINRNTNLEKLSRLRTIFRKEGSVTAGNASGINDGASVLILMSESKAKELCIDPLVAVISYASSGVSPEIMGTGPITSTEKALEKASLTINDIDLIEANEAFASQAISVIDELNLDESKVNINGGAIALGHPIGASGARILTTLIYSMKKRESRYGLATLCIGGGQGISLIVEKYNS